MGRNKCLIFFSWQSDIPECRKFIQKALTKFRNKATELGLDSIEIDRDTRNVPGSPDIPDTIFEKIKRCDIFVADVTIINRDLVPEESSHRLTPNPNVMLELGYALAAIGESRVILLNCDDFANANELPFDFNHKRTASFSLKPEKTESRTNEIADNLARTIRMLKETCQLHGGCPEILDIRMRMADFLERSIARIVDGKSVSADDRHIREMERLKDILTPETYDFLHELVSDLVQASKDVEDQGYLNSLIETYTIESFYQGFRNVLPKLKGREIVNERCYAAIREIAGNDVMPPYSYSRYRDVNLVFCSNPENLEAYSKDGILLCKGKRDDQGKFTGFVITSDVGSIYVGNIVDDRKSGDGCLYHDPQMGDPAVPLFKGRWEDNRLVEGKCYSLYVEVPKGNEINEIELDYETCRYDCRHVIDGVWMDADVVDYIIADVEFKDGIGRVIPESVERYSDDYEQLIHDEAVEDVNAYIAIQRMKRNQLEPFNMAVVPCFDCIDCDFDD